jgi:4-hydroxy-tetrahydrodipicolinate synthase
VEKLSKHPNIIGIKEASGNISYAVSVSRFVNENFAMYSGNDDMVIPILSLGGSGVISVFANTNPKECHDMVANWMEGKQKEALDIQQKYLDYIHALFCEVNPIPVKKAVNLMGQNAGPLRMPLTEMTPANTEKLRKAMQNFGLI